MPTIRVDDAVYERLKEEAEPFVDNPNSVLRRLLGIEEQSGSSARPPRLRARSGELLDRRTYDDLILRVLAEKRGSGGTNEVVDAVGDLVREQLTPMDLEENSSGVIRWRNRIMWRRFQLVQQGLLRDDSARGTWQLSEAGWERARALDG